MRVLIVEDEPAIARRIERFTRELLGPDLTAIELCTRLDDAERTVERAAFDVVLLISTCTAATATRCSSAPPRARSRPS